MGDRAVYCARLESVCAERHRGFESPPIRPASRLRLAGSVVETLETITIGRILPIAVLPDYLPGSALG